MTVDCIINLENMRFDVMDIEKNDRKRPKAMDTVLKKRPSGTRSEGNSGGSSPISPTSVLPELPDNSNDDDLFEGFMIQSGDKYALRWMNRTVAAQPPADKKFKLDLGDAVQGTYKKLSETLEVVGDRNDLTTLKLRAAKQWLGKSMSHPELSALDSQVQPLYLISRPLPKLSVPPTKTIKLPSIDSTLSVHPVPESINQLPLPSALPPTNGLVQSISNGVSPLLPPLPPQEAMTPPILNGPPAPPPPPLDFKVPPAPLPPSLISSPPPPPLDLKVPPAPPSLPSSLKISPPPPPLDLKVPPAPPSLQSSLKSSPPPPPPLNLKGPPPPPPPSNLRGPPPPPPPLNLKGPPPPPPPSNLRGPPPPPPMISSKGFPPLPPILPTNGAAPPLPPSLGGRTLGPRSASKLKRSSQMGNLYRLLKGKVEGSSLNGKSTQGRKSQVGSGTAGKQGMADACRC